MSSFKPFFVLYITLFLTLYSLSVAAAYTRTVTLTQLTNAFVGNCPNETIGEVITCQDALPYINAAIKKYNLRTKAQKAAYIANMAYEGGYLKYNHNLVHASQGTRSIMPASSLKLFVEFNEDVQRFWPNYPQNFNNETIVDVLIKNHADFEPAAWWTTNGPGCASSASTLSGSNSSFVSWETSCINGGLDTIPARSKIYAEVYSSL